MAKRLTNKKSSKNKALDKPETLLSKFEDGYIEQILLNPRNKSKALLNAGYEGKYLAQYATKLHDRLRDRIMAEFERRKLDYALLGHSTIIQSCDDESGSVRLQAGKALMDYGGHSVGSTIDVNVNIGAMSDQALDNRIADLERSLLAARGDSIDAEYTEVEDSSL